MNRWTNSTHDGSYVGLDRTELISSWAQGKVDEVEHGEYELETAWQILDKAYREVDDAKATYVANYDGAIRIANALENLQAARERAQRVVDEPF